MKKHLSIIVVAMLIISACSKSITPPPTNPPITPPVTPPGETWVQFGTPFDKVPDPADITMYQVNTRAFSVQGNLAGVTSRLDSIKALGINVIYLMPVYPVGAIKSVNSPYCIKDFKAVATEFGTLDDLRNLVAAAHGKGMSVILDWVANHTAWDNPWISTKSWYQQDAAGNIISPVNTGWNDVAALNYSNTDMRKAMISAMKYWVYAANIDGYRCDAADFVPADFWKQAIDSLRGITTHKLLLLAEGTRQDHFTSGFQMKYGMGFFYNMKNNIYGAARSVASVDSVNTVEYTNASASSQVVRYTSNHDVDNAEGTPMELFDGANGAMAAFVTAAYLKGVPMIYNGQEVGCDKRLNYFNNSTPINWNINPGITAEYKKILAFRNNSAAIKTGTLTTYNTTDVCSFTKTAGSSTVLVLVNMRNTPINYTVPAAIANTAWKDAFSGAVVTVATQFSLQPFEYKIVQKN